MKNKYDYSGQCFRVGDAAEKLFIKIATDKGLEVEASSRSDQLKHVDCWITKDGERYGIDVKAQKKSNRADKDPQDEFCWIEIKGVRKNGSSWLINGKAKFIAFERADHFLIVDREELAALIPTLCDLDTWAKSSKDALYKSYKRKERENEHLTIIKFSDIENLKKSVWEKDKIVR